jgi:hypothetical protein
MSAVEADIYNFLCRLSAILTDYICLSLRSNALLEGVSSYFRRHYYSRKETLTKLTRV